MVEEWEREERSRKKMVGEWEREEKRKRRKEMVEE